MPLARIKTMMHRFVVSAVVATAGFSGQVSGQNFTYEMVPVGDAGNSAGFYSYGAVAEAFQIGKYEVTIGQYADFLNAVAKSDDFLLYNPRMETDLNSAGIARTGSDGAYSYSVIDNFGDSTNRPITYVGWFDAARFANWMANGQPMDLVTPVDTAAVINDGAYTIGTAINGAAPTRNVINPLTGAAPTFYIPTENEWFKAAFYSPLLNDNQGGYSQYATQVSGTPPGNVIGGDPNQVNYIVQPSGFYSVPQNSITSPTQNYLTDVGSFTGSASYYGTFDQNGNVWEITDSAFGTNRALLVVRGGGWTSYENYMWDSYRLSTSSSGENSNGGFRLAGPALALAAVPEPATLALIFAGLVITVLIRLRRGRTAKALVACATLGIPLQHGHSNPVDYELVIIGNAGNAENSTTGIGGVSYDFHLGKYDVTIGQYTAFLNIVARTDAYFLFNENMTTNLNIAGIARTGTEGSYTYSVMDNFGSSANRPITYVSWFDAARFTNWMANGQPTDLSNPAAATENGAYDLLSAAPGIAPQKNTINPNTGATPAFYLPTQDEWYKAAYFSPNYNGTGSPGYYTYAMQSDATPGNVVGSGANQTNIYRGVFSFTQSSVYSSTQNYLTEVGAFSGSPGFYGTFDMNGNVYQWNDLDGTANASRGLIGGFWFGGPASAANTTLASQAATYEGNDVGFRLAAPIPEPGTLALAGIAALALLMAQRRSRKRFPAKR